ncbi:MAG TPA: hypothetical protein PKA28_04040 [Methylomusa anaerophila]|uniref:Uncharacterized protein n=1 Tax=Methylomusa anaerophila TaxID=1930071 RepID=A0A348AN98_9FIRM|nr:hypothetical protein [Methylomusa anaerophila]BBB92546.1 hypothetical protein MAMMFC1_03241 [Methylomusa anaerophila]HML87599.1 hypothetical protein [Methylomusa anaerophila]
MYLDALLSRGQAYKLKPQEINVDGYSGVHNKLWVPKKIKGII